MKTTIYTVLGVAVVLGLSAAMTGAAVNADLERDITKFRSVQDTVDRARARGASLESAAIQLKIVEKNEWLAVQQRMARKRWFSWLVPASDEVLQLKPIE